jgi:hypothetical protein
VSPSRLGMFELEKVLTMRSHLGSLKQDRPVGVLSRKILPAIE